MNTEKTLQILSVKSASAVETEKLGELIGGQLKGGEVIELMSDLGGGKTTFVRGLAKGFGSKDKVASPSFTISKVYKSAKLTINHFDFYRLKDAGLLEYELIDSLNNDMNITVIEWANIVKDVLPKEYLHIAIDTEDQNTRIFKFITSTKYYYLLDNIKNNKI